MISKNMFISFSEEVMNLFLPRSCFACGRSPVDNEIPVAGLL